MTYIVVVIILGSSPAGAIKVLNPAPTGEAYQRAEPVEIAVVELRRAAPAKNPFRFHFTISRDARAGERTRYIEKTNAGNGVFIAGQPTIPGQS